MGNLQNSFASVPVNEACQFREPRYILVFCRGKLILGSSPVRLNKTVFDDNKPEAAALCPLIVIFELFLRHRAVVGFLQIHRCHDQAIFQGNDAHLYGFSQHIYVPRLSTAIILPQLHR